MRKSEEVAAVGRRIAEIRRMRGHTQEALAERLAVSVKYVQRIERGLENMTLETLGKLTRALDVATSELFVAPTVVAPRVGRPPRSLPSVALAEPAIRVASSELDRGPSGEVPIPLLTAAAAAGYDGEASRADIAAWVLPVTRRRWDRSMFVLRVIGRSMEPRIPDGSFCLLRFTTEFEGKGEIALVELRDRWPVELGARFVMKHVIAERDARRRVRAIVLRSESAAFADVRIPIVAEAPVPPLRVVGVHVDTLGLAAPHAAKA